MNQFFKRLIIFMFMTTVIFSSELSEKTKIVVLPFTDLSGSEELYNAPTKLSSTLAGKLSEIGRFEVIDRTEIETILEEQKLSLSGMVDSEQIVQVGKLASANLAFTGNILSLNVYRGTEKQVSELDLGIVNLTKTEEVEKVEWYAEIKINIKILDVETGELIDSFEEEAEFETTKIHTANSAIDGVIDLVTTSAPYKIRNMFKLKTYIIERQGDMAIIRLGSDLGVKKNMEFYIYDDYKIIVDDRTGEELKISGDRKGLLYVTEVDNKSAHAKIVRGKGSVTRGDILSEKLFPSISLDLSIGLAPFNMNAFEIDQNYSVLDDKFKASINIDQSDKESVPYISFYTKRAYRGITPSLGTKLYFNSPIIAVGADFGASMVGELFERLGIELYGGVGGNFAFANVGKIEKVETSLGEEVLDFIFPNNSEPKDGEDIDLTGFNFFLKGQAKSFVNINDTVSLFGEAGYKLATDTDWKISTTDKDDESIDLTSNFNDSVKKIPNLDMSGLYYGGGIRFTF